MVLGSVGEFAMDHPETDEEIDRRFRASWEAVRAETRILAQRVQGLGETLSLGFKGIHEDLDETKAILRSFLTDSDGESAGPRKE